MDANGCPIPRANQPPPPPDSPDSNDDEKSSTSSKRSSSSVSQNKRPATRSQNAAKQPNRVTYTNESSATTQQWEQVILAKDRQIAEISQKYESISQQLTNATQRIDELIKALNLERNVKSSVGYASSSSSHSAGEGGNSDEDDVTLTHIAPFDKTDKEKDETVIDSQQPQSSLGSYKVIGKAAKKKLAKEVHPLKGKNAVPSTSAKPRKPPIIVCSKATIAKTTKEVQEILGHRDFIINGSHVQTSSLADHNKLKATLTDYHTFPSSEEKKTQLVLCNLCPTTTEQEVLDEFAYLHLEQHVHKVTRFFTDKSKRAGLNLPMWRIQLLPGCDFMRILKIRNFLNQKVRFERIKNHFIPQCGNCQLFGHTSKYCARPYRCVKCTTSHAKGACARDTLIDKNLDVACVNCKLTGHPANFRGCKYFTDLQEKKQNQKAAQQLKELQKRDQREQQRDQMRVPAPPTPVSCGLV